MHNLEADGLSRALANASTALDAVALINLSSTISNSDGTDRASTDAALAADAFLFVNLSSHFFLLVNGCRGSFKRNSILQTGKLVFIEKLFYHLGITYNITALTVISSFIFILLQNFRK